MSSYKDRYVEILKRNDTKELGLFVDELIRIVDCYEFIYDELKDTIDANFINKNKNRTVFLKDIVKNTGGSNRDITVIKKNP